MMYLQAILFVGSCIFLAAECSDLRKRFVWCDDLKECTRAFDVYGDPSASTVLLQLTEGNKLNEYCRSIQGMDSCVSRHKGNCWADDEVTAAEFAVEMGDFMCRADIKSDFLQVARLSSSCLDDASARNVIDTETLQCATDFENAANDMVWEIQIGFKSASDLCPLTVDMGKCMMNKIKSVCDTTVTNFYDKMVTYVVNVNAGKHFGCAAAASHLKRLVQRSLTYMAR